MYFAHNTERIFYTLYFITYIKLGYYTYYTYLELFMNVFMNVCIKAIAF